MILTFLVSLLFVFACAVFIYFNDKHKEKKERNENPGYAKYIVGFIAFVILFILSQM